MSFPVTIAAPSVASGSSAPASRPAAEGFGALLSVHLGASPASEGEGLVRPVEVPAGEHREEREAPLADVLPPSAPVLLVAPEAPAGNGWGWASESPSAPVEMPPSQASRPADLAGLGAGRTSAGESEAAQPSSIRLSPGATAPSAAEAVGAQAPAAGTPDVGGPAAQRATSEGPARPADTDGEGSLGASPAALAGARPAADRLGAIGHETGTTTSAQEPASASRAAGTSDHPPAEQDGWVEPSVSARPPRLASALGSVSSEQVSTPSRAVWGAPGDPAVASAPGNSLSETPSERAGVSPARPDGATSAPAGRLSAGAPTELRIERGSASGALLNPPPDAAAEGAGEPAAPDADGVAAPEPEARLGSASGDAAGDEGRERRPSQGTDVRRPAASTAIEEPLAESALAGKDAPSAGPSARASADAGRAARPSPAALTQEADLAPEAPAPLAPAATEPDGASLSAPMRSAAPDEALELLGAPAHAETAETPDAETVPDETAGLGAPSRTAETGPSVRAEAARGAAVPRWAGLLAERIGAERFALTAEPGGWRTLTLDLGEGEGTIRVRARAQEGSLALSVHLSNPEARAAAAQHAEAIRARIEQHYGAPVDLAFDASAGQEQGHARGEHAPERAAPRLPRPAHGAHAPAPPTSAPPPRTRGWIG